MVLVEIGQALGSFRGKFVVVGGVVPRLLLGDAEMEHVGTIDVDISLDAEALGDEQYANLIEELIEHGYKQREELRRFQLVRSVAAIYGSGPIEIIVDFLMPRHAEIVKNVPPLISDFAVQRADGADLALRFYQMVEIAGPMPAGGKNSVQLAVCSIPALLAMKGHAIDGRYKAKDAYDIYYCVRNHPGGPEALATECRPLLDHPSGKQGFEHIASKFNELDGYGPSSVRQFVEGTDILDGRTLDQWQQDAFRQVDNWLRALGLQEAAPN